MRLLSAIVASLTTQFAIASTPIDGWYGTVFGGYANIPDNISTTRDGVARTNANYQAGYHAGGSIGFKSNPMRYEGEITYMNANINHFRVNNIRQTSVSGYNNNLLAMANVYYDFPVLLEPFQPFAGIGIGYAWVHAILNSQGPSAATQFSGSNSVFAYQATAGVTYNFSEFYALNAGYRYVATIRSDSLGKIVQASLVNLGVVFRFDQGKYK